MKRHVLTVSRNRVREYDKDSRIGQRSPLINYSAERGKKGSERGAGRERMDEGDRSERQIDYFFSVQTDSDFCEESSSSSSSDRESSGDEQRNPLES